MNILNFAVVTLLLLISFPIWRLTTDTSQDPKIFIALIVFSVLSLVPFRSFKGEEIKNDKKNISPLLFFFLLVLVLIYWYLSPYHYTATQYLAIIWSTFLAFILGVKWGREHIVTVFFKGVMIVGVIASFYGLCEYWGLIHNYDLSEFFPPHVSGHVGHKNTYGFVLMLGVICSFAFMMDTHEKKYFAIFLLLFIALSLSDSRGSQFLTIFGLIMIIIPSIRERFKAISFKAVLLPSLFIGLTTLLAFYLIDDVAKNRILHLFTNGDSFREAVYGAQWRMFLDSPLWGHGLGGFTHKATEYWPSFFREKNNFKYMIYSGHNEMLETLVQFGLLGFVPYFYFWIGAVVIGIKKVVSKWSPRTYLLLILLLMMIMHSLISVASRKAPSMYLLWFVIGCFWKDSFAVGIGHLSKKIKRYYRIALPVTALLVFSVYTHLLIGDFYYQNAINKGSISPSSLKAFEKTISIYREHPATRYQLTRLLIAFGLYEEALLSCKELQQSSPHIFPIEMLFAEGYKGIGELDSALHYINRSLYYHGSHLESLELKSQILCQMESVELLEVQNIAREKMQMSKNAKEPSYEELVGGLRSKNKKSKLRERFEKYRENYSKVKREEQELLRRILEMNCGTDK